MTEIQECHIGDEFHSPEERQRMRDHVFKWIRETYGHKWVATERCEDTTMKAVGNALPARRRRVYVLTCEAG